jgi:hypothetical protein
MKTTKELNMKQMTAKFRGRCTICSEPINPGDTINYHGRGHVDHAECDVETTEDQAAGFEPGTLANDRWMARRGVSVTRFAGGATMTRNSAGRCIDAPCCGCCD